MEAENMTPEQLMELAQAKAGEVSPADSARAVEVDGVDVRVDMDALRSWTAFKAVRDIEAGAGGVAQIDAAMRLVELVTDLDEDAIVAHCGGEKASATDVVAFAMRVIKELYPKN